MKLLLSIGVMAFILVGLSACAPQNPNDPNAQPLIKQDRPLSPAAAISAGSGFPHNGMNAPQ